MISCQYGVRNAFIGARSYMSPDKLEFLEVLTKSAPPLSLRAGAHNLTRHQSTRANAPWPTLAVHLSVPHPYTTGLRSTSSTTCRAPGTRMLTLRHRDQQSRHSSLRALQVLWRGILLPVLLTCSERNCSQPLQTSATRGQRTTPF